MPWFWLLGTLSLAVVALRPRAFRVAGDSMAPTLAHGTLVFTVRPLNRLIRDGSVVTLADPREPSRLLIKRVAARLDDLVDLRGDNPDASTDSRTFGLQRVTTLTGVLVLPRIPATGSR